MKARLINGAVVDMQAKFTRAMGETAQMAQIIRKFTAELENAETHEFPAIKARYAAMLASV